MIVGDKGYLGRFYTEVSLPISDSLKIVPKAFVERGAASYAHPQGLQASDTQTLTDAGLEMGVKFTQLIDATLGYAKSIQDKNISDAVKDASNARLYFRISIKI